MDEREKLDAPSGDVERVAKAICDTLRAESGFIEDTLDLNPEFWTDVAEAALSAMPLQAGINEGLEMAAKVADGYHERALEWAKNVRGVAELISETDSSRIAAEVRAMKVEK